MSCIAARPQRVNVVVLEGGAEHRLDVETGGLFHTLSLFLLC